VSGKLFKWIFDGIGMDVGSRLPELSF